MSRLRFLFSLAALVALASALVACGGGGDSSGENPQQVIDTATLRGIESGNLDLSLSLKAEGREGGNVDVSLSGPFQGGAKGKLPQLDMTAKASGSIGGEDIDFDGGLVLLPNSAYVNYQGIDYEVDPTTFSFVESVVNQAQQQGAGEGEPTDVTACQEAAAGLEVGEFVDDLKNEGSADVGGTGTTKVSGDLNVSGALDSLLELAEAPACSAQLGAAGPLPSQSEVDAAKDQVTGALKTAHVDLYVGEDDIVRQVSAQLKIEPEDGGDGPQSVEIEFDLTLTGVNEEQEIAAPDSAKPLNDLFLKLGVNPIELLGLLQGEGGGAGLGSLLEGLGGATGGGSSGGSDSGGGGGRQSYLECLQGVRSAADLQKCEKLR